MFVIVRNETAWFNVYSLGVSVTGALCVLILFARGQHVAIHFAKKLSVLSHLDVQFVEKSRNLHFAV